MASSSSGPEAPQGTFSMNVNVSHFHVDPLTPFFCLQGALRNRSSERLGPASCAISTIACLLNILWSAIDVSMIKLFVLFMQEKFKIAGTFLAMCARKSTSMQIRISMHLVLCIGWLIEL
jgi:hypothetical protein